MTGQKKPETLDDDDLDTAQGGSGKASLGDITMVKYVDNVQATQDDGFIAFGNEGSGLKKDG